jgi:hypothetical protein
MKRPPTTIKSFRLDKRVVATLGEVAAVEGSNVNRIASAVLTAWLAHWLALRNLEHEQRQATRPQ